MLHFMITLLKFVRSISNLTSLVTFKNLYCQPQTQLPEQIWVRGLESFMITLYVKITIYYTVGVMYLQIATFYFVLNVSSVDDSQ